MSVLLRPSVPGDIPRLKELWKRCFGDEDAYIDHYFQTAYRPDCALLLEHGGIISSMLLTFPFEVSAADGGCASACYIYAFCTDPALQSRGYGRRLLAYAETQAALRGCAAAIMVPGGESLFRFYESLGYVSAISCREETLCAGEAGESVPRPCTVEYYRQQREKWLAGLNHISYPLPVLEYQHSLCQNSGGGFYALGSGVAAVERDGGVLYVKELLTDEPEQAVSALLGLLGGQRAQVRFPVLSGEKGRPFGVVKWLTALPGADWKNGWLAFGFD